ncbi:ribonuclease P protein component [Candidatus Parcubacteria bacterium]|nr:ribonuclease P protein component [Candidatus Parcubacteria bacterium]
MLSKENRLRNKKDFDRIFKKGKGFKQDFLFLKLIKNNLETNRFGFIVSQKISKKAVIRNKIKRRLRESIKAKSGEMRVGYDVVLLPDTDIKEKSFEEINENVNRVLIKAKILTK